MSTATDIIDALRDLKDDQQRSILLRFFKTAPGQYGEGDEFWGIRVPQTRSVVAHVDNISEKQLTILLHHPIHEVRLAGFLILVKQMKAALPSRRRPEGHPEERDRIVRFYLQNAKYANNWDLVDLSAPGVLGVWGNNLSEDRREEFQQTLYQLSQSTNLWKQRISIVSTLTLVRAHKIEETLTIANILLGHPHDLMQKAVGWLLREVGKIDMKALEQFLENELPRLSATTLRYAIERMPYSLRQEWLSRKALLRRKKN